MKRLLLLAGLVLVGCTDTQRPLSPTFGQAVNANIAAQVVNPAPAYDAPGLSDGQRIDNAVHRYRTNRVYEPHLPLEGGQIYDNGKSDNKGGDGAASDPSSAPQQ